MSSYQQPIIKEDNPIGHDPDHPPGWLSMVEGAYLKVHAANAQMRNVLEIGSLCGRSTSFILEGLKERFVDNKYWLWCVEPWSFFRPWLIENVGIPPAIFWNYMTEHGFCNNIHLLQCTSLEASSIVTKRKYDFAFIDGDHTAPYVWHDLLMCSQVTKTMLLHDYSDKTKDFQVVDTVNKWVEVTEWTVAEVVGQIIKLTYINYGGLKKVE